MEGLITFWTWVYIIGLSCFCLLVVLVIPLGARDMFRMFRQLASENPEETTGPTDDQS